MIVSPQVGIWLSVALAIGGVITGLGAEFVDLGLTAGEVKAVMAGDTIILTLGNAVNAVLHMIPASQSSSTVTANQFPLGPKAS